MSVIDRAKSHFENLGTQSIEVPEWKDDDDKATVLYWSPITLSEKNKLQLFVPRGFAHAFLVLSETAVFSYKVDNYYSASSDSGIMWNDPTLDIDWPLPSSELIISEKDRSLLKLSKFKTPF